MTLRNAKRLSTAGACLAVAASATQAYAQSDDKIAKLEKDNQALQQRLDALEAVAKKEGIIPSGPSKPVWSASTVTLSGFVTSSYFHDSDNPSVTGPTKGISPGYLWNRVNDSFTVNKIKLTLASPAVERSGDKFDAAFRTSLMFGQDAPIVNSSAKTVGFDNLREAYVELNAPIGTGLNIKAGELISLLNYESGDGGAANNNFSQGYQWFFTGNGPAAGLQLGYTLTDSLDLKVRVQNGLYAGPVDNNSAKTVLAALGFKPTDKIWLSLIGFGGREDSFAQSVWGGSLLAGWQVTPELSVGTELDYFNFYNLPTSAPAGNSPVWSTGLWTAYDFTKEFGVGVRTEFLSDRRGADASGGGLGFLNPPGTGQDLSSIAFTINYKPLPFIKLQPEIRYDHTSWGGGFVSGKQDRVIFGAGATYLF